jgi:hypothetical protein
MLSTLLLSTVALDRQYAIFPAAVRVSRNAESHAGPSPSPQTIAESFLLESHIPRDEMGLDTKNARWKYAAHPLVRLSSYAYALDYLVANNRHLLLPAVQIAESGFYYNERKRCIACCACGLRIDAILMYHNLQRLLTENDLRISKCNVLGKLLAAMDTSHDDECRCKFRANNDGKHNVLVLGISMLFISHMFKVLMNCIILIIQLYIMHMRIMIINVLVRCSP